MDFSKKQLDEIKRCVEEGQLIKALKKAHELEEQQETSPDIRNKGQKIIEVIYKKLGSYWQREDLDEALEFYFEDLTLAEQAGDLPLITSSLVNIAVIFRTKGNLDEAIKFFEKALIHERKQNDLQTLASVLTDLGVVYKLKNDLETALKFYLEGLSYYRELKNRKEISVALMAIGGIYELKGMFSPAIDYTQKSLALGEELKNSLLISESLFRLIQLFIRTQDIEAANRSLNSLKQVIDIKTEKIISIRGQIAEALVLKSSKRMIHKSQAQEILQKVVKETKIGHWLPILAKLNLCELLIDELRLYNEPEVLQQVKRLLTEINDIALHRQSVELLGNSILLRARFSLMEGDAQSANAYLERAKVLAEERGFDQLSAQITTEQENLRKEFERWVKQIDQNAPFKSQFEEKKIANYVEEIKRYMQHIDDIV